MSEVEQIAVYIKGTHIKREYVKISSNELCSLIKCRKH